MSGDISDHYLVKAKLRVDMKWIRAKQAGGVREIMKVNELDKREQVTEYQKLESEWNTL